MRTGNWHFYRFSESPTTLSANLLSQAESYLVDCSTRAPSHQLYFLCLPGHLSPALSYFDEHYLCNPSDGQNNIAARNFELHIVAEAAHSCTALSILCCWHWQGMRYRVPMFAYPEIHCYFLPIHHSTTRTHELTHIHTSASDHSSSYFMDAWHWELILIRST